LTIDLKRLLRDRAIPIRLLVIGLPLSMLLGTLVAIPLFPGAGIALLALMALILSPTDAALGQAVVKSEKVPERVRRWISVESGLNDGIALPPVFACIAILTLGVGGSDTHWFLFLLQQVVLGAVIGGGIGWLGGWLVSYFSARGWMNHTFQQLVSVSLALLCFALAETVHGNGFIAAFAGGLLLGTATRSDEIRERIQEFGEAFGQQLILFVFLIFAMAMVPFAIPWWDLNAWIYALISLTLIRMWPVAIALIGTHMRRDTALMMGWVGPRGLASVVFTLMAFESFREAGRPHEMMFAMAGWTILLSVVLHGFSAVPLASWYARRLETADPEAPELLDVPELRTRRGRSLSLPHIGQ
jgi:NhaP-type Na+/H+ or K+/H+ antiporter